MKKILIIGYTWPEPNSTGAGTRMYQLIQFFSRLDYKITMASAAAKSEHSAVFDKIDVEEVPILLNDSSFDEFVSDYKPDVVLFDRF